MTLGEERVITTFNPSQKPEVNFIKERTAELIDYCEQIKLPNPRWAALAQTAYEEAAMWAVKAATA